MKKKLKKIGQAIARGIIGTFCKLVYRVEIRGKENVPKNGSLLFCGNHKSYLDAVMILCYTKRDMRFMGKEELKKNPIIAILAKLFDVIYVKRDSKDITPLKEALKTLKAGGCIGIFPEGTRNGFAKNNDEIKGGASYLALKTGSKVVPMGILGTAKPFTKNVLVFGEPLDFSEYASGKKFEKDDQEKVSEIIKEKILELANMEI